MSMKTHDLRKLRETFSRAQGKSVPEITVDGDDLEVTLIPADNQTGLLVPINEDGDCVLLTVSNSVLKRWRAECQEAVRLMRRVAHGERNTDYRNMEVGQ